MSLSKCRPPVFDVADVTLLAFVQLAVALVGKEIGKAHDRVQRGTQLMTHGGQKSIFEFVGALGFLFGMYKGFFHSVALANLVGNNNAVNGQKEKDDHDDQDRNEHEDPGCDMHVDPVRAQVPVDCCHQTHKQQSETNPNAPPSTKLEFHFASSQFQPIELHKHQGAAVGGLSGRRNYRKFLRLC